MVAKKKNKNLSKRSSDWFGLIAMLVFLVLINVISTRVFQRFDLTSENRYSLTDATTNQLETLDDIVFVRVYLEGDLPPEYKRLRDATQEILDEFRAYAQGNLEYEFIDPSASPDEKERVNVYRNLTEQGLQYNSVRFKEGDKVSEKIIFPGAIFSYQGREIPVQILKSRLGADEEVMVNNSIQQLEYEFASTIAKVTRTSPKNIAFIKGHGELNEFELADMVNGLLDLYNVEQVEIDGQLNALKTFDAAVIAKPQEAFSEKDKFILDQFIMKGGKAIWLVEPVYASMDSLQKKSTTLAIPKQLNLEDQLFKYGVRINTNLIMDLQALPLPVVTSYVGNQPKQEFFPWYYFPLLMSNSDHPIVKNMDAIKTEFVSTIDTVGNPGIKKSILLTSSPYSKVVRTPVRVSLNMLREEPDERQFSKGPQPVAVLLEGKFPSNFSGRIPPQIANDPNIAFKEESIENQMIVISDGDIIRNEYRPGTEQIRPLGYYKFTNRIYSNKDFLMNCFNYLLDDSGLIESRTKEFKIRLLDPEKSKRERNQWQATNTALPIILIVVYGIVHFYVRRKKYGTQKN